MWWDTALRSGEAYDEVTEAALRAAKAVVVLWSSRSVASRWVRAEATIADRCKTLVPVMIEACERPIMFELTQTAELGQWTGDAGDRAWRSFVEDVRKFVGKEAPATSVSSATTKKPSIVGSSGIPTIAVAAFADHSSGKDQAGFVEGLTEELRAELARFSSLALLRNAAAARYVLSGSVRGSGARLRVAVELHTNADDTQLWSARFDGSSDDEFALQEEVARAAAGQADAYVLQQELARAVAVPEADKSAYDLVITALGFSSMWDLKSQMELIRLSEKALALEPDYALAHMCLCIAHCIIFQSGWGNASGNSQKLGLEHGRKALLAGEISARVVSNVSICLVPLGGDLANLNLIVDRALAREPANTRLLVAIGWTKAAIGQDIEGALDLLNDAERSDTNEPTLYITLIGIAACHLQQRRFDEAIRWARESVARRPSYGLALSVLAAAHAHAGQLDEAKATFANIAPETPHEITIAMFRDPNTNLRCG